MEAQTLAGVAVGTLVALAATARCVQLFGDEAPGVRWFYGEKAADVSITGRTHVKRTTRYSEGSQLVFASPRDGVPAGRGTWKVKLGDPTAFGSGNFVPDWIGVADLRGVMGNPNSLGLSAAGGVFRGGKLLRKTRPLWAGETVAITVDAEVQEVQFAVDGELVARVESDFRPHRLGVLLARVGEAATLLSYEWCSGAPSPSS
eukprot:TRINITY_DN7438_c0_g1_i2.p2 TRINITY_DN7438_c0_g1~~TRINITY_DN7438_c0_g1_i2.p2  ORF type:complete len:218 (+),score=50.56 TRINITY_DN7438_c0_g1_i2:47-655(+)